jgi:hypothetical protein
VVGLKDVREFLAQDRVPEAISALSRTADRSAWFENARAVCYMRLGQPEKAVSIYRSLLLGGGVVVRQSAPVTFKANFATALLLAGNTEGGITILDEIGQSDDASVGRLRDAVARWRKSLNLVQRILAAAGAPPAKPVLLDFAPGVA